ncbi:unnamed protein product [Paramecium sonneborni]|uniref:Uncharacterized protein n=1 Tax=Paramecium sonneborni TaxID=65129 RepID=A0A8S1PRP3_9CILI|nr:unnamed protein product [Paramecium sonneborni]
MAQIQQFQKITQIRQSEYTQKNPENENLQDLIQRKQNAEYGLNGLDKQDISQIKRFAHPPIIVEKVMIIVCILLSHTFREENQNWSACQKIIYNMQFLGKLRALEIEKINDKQQQQLQYIHSISEEQGQRVSFVCQCFYKCIKTIVEIRESQYYKVKRQIQLIE